MIEKNRKTYISSKSLIDIVIYLILLCVILLLPSSYLYLSVLGVLLIFATIYGLWILRKSGSLFVLLTLLSIMNLSIIYGCFWFYTGNVFSWQIKLVETKEHMITAKSFAVFYMSIMMGLLASYKTKAANKSFNLSTLVIRGNREIIGKLVYIVGLLVMIYALIFSFNRTFGVYSPASSTLYEYVVVLFIISWINMPKKKIYKIILIIYALIYILQGLIFGDRSSSFPMLIILYVISKKEIKNYSIILLSFWGIFGANLIGIYRQSFHMKSDIISTITSRLLYVDSAAYSFYTGVQIARAAEVIPEKMNTFLQWLMSLVIGGGGKSTISNYIASYSSSYFNRGGGLSSTHFYFWFGFVGVIIAGIIFGIILGKCFKHRNKYYPIVQLVLLAFSMRWYIYFPNVFFRTCIIIPIVIYYLIQFANQQIAKRYDSEYNVKKWN